ncbi:hypothetical protein Glove_198g121 [Diversispora epigaea]|uniref:Uncharacterized protein n=1 Tax=Diversispora epigaea TaxID=1348612 RepID=A0A397IKJ6_9GLOM|nr:hypothetical protein Glove_198g121 [Diversispora epigaea]
MFAFVVLFLALLASSNANFSMPLEKSRQPNQITKILLYFGQKLISEPLHKPSPEVSNHTKSNSDWNFPIIPTISKNNKPTFELPKGWVLKDNLRLDNEKVEKNDGHTKDMITELKKIAETEEI